MSAAVKRIGQLCLLALSAAVAPGTCAAFTAEGHRVVGIIADAGLCARARSWISPLLEGNTLANVGVWADSVRDDPAWIHTRSWHFINVGDREPLARAVARSPDNVISAIERAERVLADGSRSARERAEALRFYVHFVADVHQPLHVGRAGDRGGNDVPLRWRGEAMSLHELWDARRLLREEGLDTAGLAAAIGALATVQGAGWRAGTALDWAGESRDYRPLAYGLPAARGARTPDRAYLAATRNVVHLRLAQAGERLAWRLNRLGGCPGPSAATPSR